jgi:membrane protein YdbS with pleckstrin-like domain
MKTYNKIMLYFWLLMAVFLFVVVTYMSISDGFSKWSFYYVFAGIAILMFIVRRWMIKRMDKHMKFLEEQKAQNE